MDLWPINKSFGGSNDDEAIELKKILVGMETAVKEVSYLMNDSTTRFRRQSIFNEIMQMTTKN